MVALQTAVAALGTFIPTWTSPDVTETEQLLGLIVSMPTIVAGLTASEKDWNRLRRT